MQQVKQMVKHVLAHGVDRGDRTGNGTKSVFGYEYRVNLQDGFPICTTKFTPFKTALIELFWYLRGDSSTQFLEDNGVKIWRQWTRQDGTIGRGYPVQLRYWKNYDGTTTDQIANLIDGLKNNPSSRRHIINYWNVADLGDMELPPCHSFIQFYVADGKLSCKLVMRSNDVPLGHPFNMVCYAALTHILAKICGYDVGDLIYSGGDVHIYHNQLDGVKEWLIRDPLPLPKLIVPDNLTSIEQLTNLEITWDDFKLENYVYHPKIQFPIAV